VIIGKFAVIVNMVCSNALFTYYLAKTVAGMILPIAEYDRGAIVMSAVASCTVSISINFIGDFGVELFYAISCISFSIVGFVLPPIYFIAQYRAQSIKWLVMCVIVLVIGGGMMILSFALTITDISQV
jgi:hypothetical protein